MRSGILIAAALACATAGCTGEPLAARGPIVLVVVDTLRADHLPCYNYARPTAPALCSLAADGVLFERAYATRTATTPSIASMLTGLPPHRHGIKHLYFVLPPAMTTLAEGLRAQGWATGGFVSSFVMVNDFSGFAQGFDVYDDDVRIREQSRDNYQRDASDTIQRAITWLRTHGPHAFLFLHLIEPHGPYTPPAPHLERFALPATGPEPALMPDYQRLEGVRTVSEYVGRYDGEIAAADAALGNLFTALRALDWYASATIILVADHGESMGEEDLWFRHGSGVHDAEARVPLFVKFPAGTPGESVRGARITTPVSVLDVYPTVLRIAAVPGDPGAPHAVDLAAIARGIARPAPPMTELEDEGGLTLAVHGDGCTGRWLLPAAAAGDAPPAPDPATWLATARQLRIDPSGADEACVRTTAERAGLLVADRVGFRLDVPVVYRADMRDESNRKRFIAARSQHGAPLDEHEREALRQLGYAE